MASKPDGGVLAAAGLRYQYLRTVDEVLDVIERGLDVAALHIEGCRVRPADDDPTDKQIVDYEVVAPDGRCLKAVQVKSVMDPANSRLFGVAAAREVFAELVKTDAEAYELHTNAPLAPETERLCELLAERRGSRAEPIAALDVPHPARLARCRLIHDPRTADELRENLRGRIARFRSPREGGLAAQASGLLLRNLAQQIFDLAASMDHREVTVAGVRELLLTDALAVAAQAGRFTWGRPIGLPPVALPDVRRSVLLERLAALLPPARHDRRVQSVAIIGLSGIGKSSLAADYAAEYADAYDLVIWVAADSEEAIRASFATVHETVGGERAEHATSLQEATHTLLAELPGTWLLIFDNASASDIVWTWLPRSGRGDVLVTSTNASAWQRLSGRLDVGTMSPAEARELLVHRLDAAGRPMTPAEEEDIDLLAEALTCWPLALELAASYLASAGVGVGRAAAYIELVRARALDDELAGPIGYPRTLVAAVLLALERLAARSNRYPTALHALAVASYMGAHAIPASLVCAAAAGREPQQDQTTSPLLPSQLADEAEIFDIIRALSTESLVRRQDIKLRSPGGSPTPVIVPALTINEIVQQVVRTYRDDPDAGTLLRLTRHIDAALKYHLPHDLLGLGITEFHATTILQHLHDRGVLTEDIARLYGNLAATRQLRGFPSEALRLADIELEWVERLWPEAWKIRAHIGYLKSTALMDMSTDARQVTRAFKETIRALQSIPPGDASRFSDGWTICRSLSGVISWLKDQGRVDVPESMLSALQKLEQRFPGGSADSADDPAAAVPGVRERRPASVRVAGSGVGGTAAGRFPSRSVPDRRARPERRWSDGRPRPAERRAERTEE